MAMTKNLLLLLVTLCLVLIVVPAESKEDRAVLVVIYGTARCKSIPSRIISNATLQVTINGTMLATGTTTSSGRFSMMANVTQDQLMALVSKEAVITAPRQACVMPADAAATKKVAAPADPSAYRISITEFQTPWSPSILIARRSSWC